MHFVPQTADWIPFRATVPANSHFVRSGFNPEQKKGEKCWIFQLGVEWIVNLSEKAVF